MLIIFSFIIFRSLTVTSDSTQSSSNASTAVTNNREIEPLAISLPLIGLLVLGIAIIVAWKRRRKSYCCYEHKGCNFFFIFSSFEWWILKRQNVFKQFRLIRFFSVKVSFEERENIESLLSSTYPSLFFPLEVKVIFTCFIEVLGERSFLETERNGEIHIISMLFIEY